MNHYLKLAYNHGAQQALADMSHLVKQAGIRGFFNNALEALKGTWGGGVRGAIDDSLRAVKGTRAENGFVPIRNVEEAKLYFDPIYSRNRLKMLPEDFTTKQYVELFHPSNADEIERLLPGHMRREIANFKDPKFRQAINERYENLAYSDTRPAGYYDPEPIAVSWAEKNNRLRRQSRYFPNNNRPR